MSNSEDILTHHGIKGMHWGVRRDPSTGVRPIARSLNDSRFGQRANANAEKHMRKQTAKADKQFEKVAKSNYIHQGILNGAAKTFNEHDLPAINNHPRFKGKDLTKDPQLNHEYHQVIVLSMAKRLNEAATSLGTNASGTRKIEVLVTDRGDFAIRTMDLRHDDPAMPIVNVKKNAKGFITSIEFVSAILDHGDNLIEDYLAHFGRLGMKWGQHRFGSGGSESTGPADVHVVKESSRGIKTAGGQGHPAHPDAVKAAIGRRKAIKSGPHALSNQELRDVVNRMNLDKQYSSLVKEASSQTKIKKGHDHVKELLAVGATVNAVILFANSAAGKAIKDKLAKSAK